MPRKSSAAVLAATAFALFGLSGAAAAAPASASAPGPRPRQYTLDAEWSPSARTLSGTEAITLRNDGAAPLPSVWLRIWANDSIPGEADGCRNPRIALEVLGGATIRRYAVSCSAVELQFAHALPAGTAATISLQFTVRVPTEAAQFGRSAGIDLLGRAVPVLAIRDRNGWHLNPDTDTGDPSYSLVARWRATIHVPDSLAVASTGQELSNTLAAGTGMRTVVTATAHARDFALAIGKLALRSATVDGVRVRVFRSARSSAADAADALRFAISAVRRYAHWYGSYGSPELDLVLTDLGFNSQEFPELVFTDPDEATVVHEVAHQWFYGIVGDDQYDEPWLDESFAAWNEEQFVASSYACNLRAPLGSHRGGLGRGLSYYERRSTEYLDVIYRGGSCALTALEQMLGRGRFLALLRREVARYRYGIIHTHDFLTLLRSFDRAAADRWTQLVGFPEHGRTFNRRSAALASSKLRAPWPPTASSYGRLTLPRRSNSIRTRVSTVPGTQTAAISWGSRPNSTAPCPAPV